jgi:peptidoglycan/LPS O-acetylase OafA/YrhL
MGPRKFLALTGVATIAVVLNHAAGWGITAMFWWAHRFRSVTSPSFDQLGSLPYWGLSIIKILTLFSVPAFFFLSGYFVAYASRGLTSTYTWKMAKVRIINLLPPYLIWSLIVFLVDYVAGTIYLPSTYLINLFLGKATEAFWFVPLLIQYYLIAPLLVPLAKNHWKLLLGISAAIQVFVQISWYMRHGYLPGLSLLTDSILYKLLFLNSGIFFFVMGIVAGLYLEEFKLFIKRYQWIFFVVMFISAILSMVEYQSQVVTDLGTWDGDFRTLFQFFYAAAFIASYLASDSIPSIEMKNLIKVGSKSYGIFLAHVPVITIAAKILYHIAPWIFGFQSVFIFLLVLCGLGIPFFFMEISSRTPIRVYYKYLFG